MDVRRTWQRLVQVDPALSWMREQDVPRARAALTRIAIALLIFLPLLATRPRAYGAASSSGVELSPMGLFCGLTAFGIATLLATNISRPTLVNRQLIELASWLLLLAMLSAVSSSWALDKVGAPAHFGVDDVGSVLDRHFSTNPVNAAVVAWVAAACTSLAMILSARGLVFRPVEHGIFVALCVAGTIIDDSAFERNRTASFYLVLVGLLVHAINRERYHRGLDAYRRHCAVNEEQFKQQSLLSSVIGSDVHERLKRKERVADSFSNLTVLFADMVGFTALSRRVSPGHLVDLLNEVFEAGDEIATHIGIEKVKTLGDCYMAVAGGIASGDRGSVDAIHFAERYLRKVEEVSGRLDIPLSLRVGIHTGPAVGGIIGVSRPAYDYWGDTVNLAARLESASAPSRILVSESTWMQTKRDFVFDEGREIEVKGIGAVRAHFVVQQPRMENIIPLRQQTS